MYKLIGPVLIKKDVSEAVSNVKDRLKFIDTQLKEIDAKINGLVEDQKKSRDRFVGLQILLKRAQEQAQEAAKAEQARVIAAAAQKAKIADSSKQPASR